MNEAINQEVLRKIQNFFDGETNVFAKGKILVMPGQAPKGVSLLVDGVVEQYDITPEGNKVTVNLFKPPAFFPMSWAINQIPNEYFFAALTEVKLKRAPAESAVEFLQANPDVTFDLLARVYKGTDALLKRLVLMARGIASARLIFEMLAEGYRFGIDTDRGGTLIRIKQSSLADRSGLARETVSRELHKLESEGLITLTKTGIVLAVDRLEERLDLIVK